jgi:methylenetetrahydrofolate dehydrogenase (NADP+)/methenyltetrahydrofolate cyclohydrolase
VRNKVRACAECGVHSRLIELPADTGEAEVLARVEALNVDPAIHGILVQLPLPPQIAASTIIEAIAPEKDVDGFHLANVGALVIGKPGFIPCTPAGVMVMLQRSGVSVAGKQAVVLGRSNIVGKPMALLLLQQDATVTICHSKTANLAAITRSADILIAAIGQPNFVTGDMVKPGACVIDVGINRLPDGKLCGDVEAQSVSPVAGWLSPVPGGVGPMTITMLLANTLHAAEQQAG